MDGPDYQALIDRFTELCQADDRVVAAILVGSRAAGTEDDHSDVDLHVVTTDGTHDDFTSGVGAFVRALGDPLFIESFDIPDIAFVIYADGTELELNVARAGELRLAGAYRVLVDKAGVVQRAAANATPRDRDLEAIRRQVHWFWHDLSHFVTAVARGQLVWAYGQLDDLRRYCLNLARLRADPAAQSEGYWKADIEVEPDALDAVRSTMGTPVERDAMLAAAGSLLALYRAWASELAGRHGIPYPADLDRLMTARLDIALA